MPDTPGSIPIEEDLSVRLDERERILAQLEAESEHLRDERGALSEALSVAVQMLRQEDVGWAVPNGVDEYGLDLSDLKKWSNEIRTAYTGTRERAANPHIRNGFMLRQSYVWLGGIRYNNIPEKTQGRADVRKLLTRSQNVRMFFGTDARRRREFALFADGLYLAIGDSRDKTLRSIPLNQITETHRDPLYGEDVIAYRWTRRELDPSKPEGTPREEKSYWVFVDWYEGTIPKTITYQGKKEEVLRSCVAFDIIPNRPDGYAYGSPDAIAAIVWARVIRDMIMNGVKMQDALAMFAFRINAASKKGADKAAYEVVTKSTAANTAVMGNDTNLVPLNSAGRGYDFNSIRFLVSTMAASLHVSGIALAADVAFAGSSYGAAQTLDLPTKLAMQSRRDEHIELDKRVLKWFGLPDAEVYFEPYDDSTSEMRAIQAAMLAWSSGTLSAEDFRALLERIFGHEFTDGIPKGVMLPNNKNSLPRKDIDTDSSGASTDSDEAPAKQKKQAATAGQGRSTGAGDTPIDQKTQSK